MNASANDHEIHALSGAYAVDALDPAEKAQFEEHLAACATCRAEVASLREATALLPETTATEPPPALRDRVLAQIATVRPLPPETPVAGPSEVVTLRSRRRPRTLLAAAAAVVAVVGGGAVVWQQVSDSGQHQTQLSAVDRVLQAADAKRVNVTLTGGVRASVVRSLTEGKAVLVTRNMPPAPSGRIYELWLQTPGGAMVPAGTMTDGGSRTVLLRGDATSATGAGITVEPKGGSESPTTEPIALFDFSRAT
ncbi:anti-sigma factor [Nocardioides pocheonensis]|uniref:Regulator of SigK n=1 Tax=Nocardioides pocheonensis TaxID=661485 RepID=A0A3N0GU73_9ACTN|nr:anti-sigma factor [Nocardioides pocheonensis]RNM15718.1 anti-sigma factor [Nocardioides pocheonensis]